MANDVTLTIDGQSLTVPAGTLLVDAAKFRMSALNRFSATSNEERVRVEGSKNRLMTVFPRKAGTFLTALAETSRNASAVSRIRLISSTESWSIPSRSLWQRDAMALA